jgi:hypothetical protein
LKGDTASDRADPEKRKAPPSDPGRFFVSGCGLRLKRLCAGQGLRRWFVEQVADANG